MATALLLGCASSSTPAASGRAPTPIASRPASPPTANSTPPAASAPAAAAPAAPAVLSTLKGVYTDAQATAGKELYVGRCVSCHTGEHGSGAFRRKWAGKPVQSLWGIIRETMPDDDPGGLSNEQYSQVVAYLLKLNGLPPGSTPLPADSLALAKIRLDTLTK